MKRLFAYDLVILAYLAIVSIIVLVYLPEGWWRFLLYHAAIGSIIAMVVYAYGRFGGGFWEVVRYWYAIPVVLCTFRELHHLFVNPGCPPFDTIRKEVVRPHRRHKEVDGIEKYRLALVQGYTSDRGCDILWFGGKEETGMNMPTGRRVRSSGVLSSFPE